MSVFWNLRGASVCLSVCLSSFFFPLSSFLCSLPLISFLFLFPLSSSALSVKQCIFVIDYCRKSVGTRMDASPMSESGEVFQERCFRCGEWKLSARIHTSSQMRNYGNQRPRRQLSEALKMHRKKENQAILHDGNGHMEAEHRHRRTCIGPLLRPTGHRLGPETACSQILENHHEAKHH